MSITLVTGSSDGIGAQVARRLDELGHTVVRHARDERRAGDMQALPRSPKVVVGDFTSLASTRDMASSLLDCGVDVIVHNAGWASLQKHLQLTDDELEPSFQIHVVAPYLLTALLGGGSRTVYVSSDSFRGLPFGVEEVADLPRPRHWTSASAYASSKLAGTALTFALAHRWPGSLINAVHPGWVRSKMSGDEAPLSVEEGADTPVWLASSEESAASVTGRLFQDRHEISLNRDVERHDVQEAVLSLCAEVTGLPPR